MNDDRFFLSFRVVYESEQYTAVPLNSFNTCYSAWLSFKLEERPFAFSEMCIAELNDENVIIKLYDFNESTRRFKLGVL